MTFQIHFIVILLAFSFSLKAFGFGQPNPAPGREFTATAAAPSGPVGGVGNCSQVPSSVGQALREVIAFKNSCHLTRGFESSGKKIVINDYSSSKPRMYVFDTSGVRCLKSVPIAWGGGGRGTPSSMKVPPRPCSGDGQKLTPPGIHYTAPHTGGSRYSEAESMGLVGLSGQGSMGPPKNRAILIHPKASAGQPSTWGCTGVPPQDFQEIKSMVGYGSLVHNYFGGRAPTSNCKDRDGLNPSGASCRQDPGNASLQGLWRWSPGGQGPARRGGKRGKTTR